MTMGWMAQASCLLLLLLQEQWAWPWVCQRGLLQGVCWERPCPLVQAMPPLSWGLQLPVRRQRQAGMKRQLQTEASCLGWMMQQLPALGLLLAQVKVLLQGCCLTREQQQSRQLVLELPWLG